MNPGQNLQPETLNDPCFFFWSMHNTQTEVFPDVKRLGNTAIRDFIRLRNVATHNERPLSDSDLRAAIDFADKVRKILVHGGPDGTSAKAPNAPSGPPKPGRRMLPPPPQVKIPRPAPIPPSAVPTEAAPHTPIVPPATPTATTVKFRPDLYSFYVVCDRSFSMLGEPMRVLNDELKSLISFIASDPGVNDRCRVSVSAFSTSAERLVPLSSASDVQLIPEIEANGVTNYGKAFAHLSSIVAEDHKALESSHRLLRPVVFFMTDGSPTDELWAEELVTLCDLKNVNPPLVIFCPLADIGPVVPKTVRSLSGVVEPVVKHNISGTLQEVVSATVKSILRSVLATTKATADECLRLDP